MASDRQTFLVTVTSRVVLTVTETRRVRAHSKDEAEQAVRSGGGLSLGFEPNLGSAGNEAEWMATSVIAELA